MRRNIIVMKHKDQLLPDGYVQLLAKQKLSSVSVVVPTKDEIMMLKSTDPFSTQEFHETQEHFKDHIIFSVFGVEYPEGFMQDDIQPFTLVEKGGRPMIVAMATGQFPGFFQEKSSHPNEFFLAHQLLMPQIKGKWDMLGGDVKKVMDDLRNPMFKTMIEPMIVGSGVVTIAGINGEVVSIPKGNLISQFPWGWTTDHIGFVEQSYPEEKQPEVEPPKGMLGKLKSGFPTMSIGGKKDDKPAEPKAEEPKETKVEAPKQTVVQLPPKDTARKVKAPSHIKGNKNLRQWYNDNAGFLPENWKQRPEVETRVPIKDFQQMASAIGTTTQTAVQAPADNAEKKDVTPHHVPAAATAEADRVAKPTQEETRKIKSLHIAPEELALVKEILSKGVAVGGVEQNGQTITNPAEIKNWEAPVPSFAEQVKMQSNVPTLQWSVDALMEIATKAPTAMVVLAAQWRALYLAELQKQAPPATTQQTQHTAKPAGGFPTMKLGKTG